MNFLVFDSFRGPKNNILGTIMSRFSAEKILSRYTEKLRGEPLCAVF